ncbi:TIGR03016 family PEP-CTERM system-associated outer membrane protein [Vibrio sp.]|nr:TIGR03016 family PEP-CTERM system-associated outer membrane protein [Vibrio sp.]
MDTVTDTAMDTAMVQRIRKSKFYLVGIVLLVARPSLAADVKITPRVESEFTYTDNVNLVATDEQSSEITSLIAGLEINADGNDGNITLDYQAQQLLYSYDSSENKLYNDLNFSADKGLFSTTNFRGELDASVTNVARNIETNASNDVTTGDTIETRTFGGGLSYQSNPLGVMDLSAKVYGSVKNNEDSIGDSQSYSGELTSKQGRAIKDYFWLADYSYDTTVGKNEENNTEATELNNELGFQPINGFSPYMHLYYEDYSGQSSSDSADSSSWGPGLKYYISRYSYFDFGYDFVLDDSNSDYFRGGFHFNPSIRTVLDFQYKKRFYGDSYAFSFTHRSRRLTNSITYVEDVSNYNRSLYVDGNEIEQLTIYKTLSWNSSLAFQRSALNLKVSTEKQSAFTNISSNTDVNKYSGELSFDHRMTRDTTISPGFSYDYYEFIAFGQTTQEDYYRKWDVDLTHSFARDLRLKFSLSYQDRSSTLSSSGYQEGRVSINLRKEL